MSDKIQRESWLYIQTINQSTTCGGWIMPMNKYKYKTDRPKS